MHKTDFPGDHGPHDTDDPEAKIGLASPEKICLTTSVVAVVI
jgi:hypothetical protein